MSLHWTEEQYRAHVTRGQPLPYSEAAWQRAVLRLLTQHGYAYVYHTFDSRRSPSGFPDLIAVHAQPGRELLCVELKTDTGQVTLAQQAWLTALAGTSGVVVAEIWRPSALDEIVKRLRR